MIACLRVLGLPARYVSGYLRTSENAVGANASHAWVAIYCPGFDWLDLDPTNNVMPSTDHVTLGWGRDYSDVPPVNGVALGGGDQAVAVEVRVVPADYTGR
jgi:transglutaminase-like putative cysteine protease